MSFEETFKKDVLARFDRAEASIPGYRFTIIRDLIDTGGAVHVAKILMQLDNVATIQYGLDILAQNDLLDCSVEQAVIDHEASGEFSAAEVATARTKLKIVRLKHAVKD
jgi:hypothetical protein